MRQYSTKNFKNWTRRTSLLAVETREKNRLSQDFEPRSIVKEGKILYTIKIENHLGNFSYEIKIRQAKRKNQVIIETFGRKSQPHGIDWLVKKLSKKLVTRWSPDTIVEKD